MIAVADKSAARAGSRIPTVCDRCGGLMVSETVYELNGKCWRCLNCGERVDLVILEHRRKGGADSSSPEPGTKRANPVPPDGQRCEKMKGVAA